MSAELRAAAQAVLEELDIIRKHRETTGVGFLVVHVDTHEDLRRALASTSIDGVSGTGLEELRLFNEGTTPGPWGTSDHREWLTDAGHRRFTVTPPYPGRSEAAHTADVDLIVAAVNHVRAALAKDAP